MTDDKLKKIVEQARVDEKELQKFPAIVRALQKLEKRIIKLEQENHRQKFKSFYSRPPGRATGAGGNVHAILLQKSIYTQAQYSAHPVKESDTNFRIHLFRGKDGFPFPFLSHSVR